LGKFRDLREIERSKASNIGALGSINNYYMAIYVYVDNSNAFIEAYFQVPNAT